MEGEGRGSVMGAWIMSTASDESERAFRFSVPVRPELTPTETDYFVQSLPLMQDELYPVDVRGLGVLSQRAVQVGVSYTPDGHLLQSCEVVLSSHLDELREMIVSPGHPDCVACQANVDQVEAFLNEYPGTCFMVAQLRYAPVEPHTEGTP